MNLKWKVGDTTITKITEITYPDFPDLIPAATPEVVKKVPWLFPHFVTPDGKLSVSIHSLVVDTPGAKLVVDTCIGNGRDREPLAIMSNLSTSYLEDMVAAGYPPESIHYVLCTHLHLDHVGWNTRLQDGRWVPTFPNARYIFSRKEWQYWEALPRDERTAHIVDSVIPIIEAGQAVLVENDYALNDEVWLEPTPGHTPDHVSVRLSSNGVQGVITGDMIHSPVQCLEPAWVMRADTDPVQACHTRRAFLERYCDTDVLVCGSHFPAPSMGRIVARDQAFWFQFVPTTG